MQFHVIAGIVVSSILLAAAPTLGQTPAVDTWVVSGQSPLLEKTDGGFVFDASLGNPEEYRYAGIASADYLGGDFQFEFAFEIARIDHWNGFAMTVGGLDSAFSAKLTRQQRAAGEQILSAETACGDRKTSQDTAETANAGAMRAVRQNGRLTLEYKTTDEPSWRTVLGPIEVGQSPAAASISFFSAKNTISRITIRSPKTTAAHSVPKHLYPVYLNSRTLADENETGGVYRVGLENGQADETGTVTVRPGGRAIYAMRGPLNAHGMGLHWRSHGAIKLSAVQLGTAETIELGETLLWDQSPDQSPELKNRGVSLSQFVSRYAEYRKWPLPHQTADNIFFIRFEPATDQEIAVADLKLTGSPLAPIKPFEPATTLETSIEESNGRLLLGWDGPSNDWWGGDRLTAGQTIELAGVPFRISPTVVNNDRPSVALPVNRQAGLLHFAHCAGPGIPSDQPWLATYLIVYDDDTTEPVFCVLRWNCGVYDSAWLARGMADHTWWGPPGFTWAKPHYLPKPGLSRGVFWNTVYVARVANPHPQKTIRRIIAAAPPHQTDFAVLGVTLASPRESYVGLIEPDEATFTQDQTVRAEVMSWRADTEISPNTEILLNKGANGVACDESSLSWHGPFGRTAIQLEPADLKNVPPGPVRFVCSALNDTKPHPPVVAQSSLLGLMPAPRDTDQPCYLSMIGGGFESRSEFERMRRLGYDAIKTQMGWEQVEPQPNSFDWTRWQQAFEEIHEQGLAVSIRNHFSIPSWLKDNISYTKATSTGHASEDAGHVDLPDPAWTDAVSRYYGAVAAFAAQYPFVISINANYGLRNQAGAKGLLYCGDHQMEAFRQFLSQRYSLEEINRKTGMDFADLNAISPKTVLADTSDFLLSNYLRSHDEQTAAVQRAVVQAIRQAGNKTHLAFNTAMHAQWHRMGGSSLDRYIRLGLDYPPASPFHETSDRYGLSFFKWLAAKRTFDLPYGDEGNQNPPTYEHNVRAYQWMMMMQCWDALYCQWYGGRPGSQNIAWLKPYYRLIYNAEYLPDPFGLAFSFESSCQEGRSVLTADNPHQPIMSHYGLANTLRACNLSADRYVIDRFPETDRDAPKLVIDDISRYLSSDFADRLEAHVRAGGTFVASGETDILNDHAFLKRFGLNLADLPTETRMILDGTPTALPGRKWRIEGDALETLAQWETGEPAVAALPVGQGRFVIFAKAWTQDDYDINLPDSYLDFCRNTLCRLGNFVPAVQTDTVNADATAYRTRDGDILVHVFNKRAEPVRTAVRIAKHLLPQQPIAADLNTALAPDHHLAVEDAGNSWMIDTRIDPLYSTVIRLSPGQPVEGASHVTHDPR
ncbi:MAG: hypothetical protein GXY33_21800 [Phycisphaerae bacterium]|nr:hypothetical protein [Phycisphaerae bacterium]